MNECEQTKGGTKSCSQICRIMQFHYIQQIGEVAEWFKAHAWKVCCEQLHAGSNPVFSANVDGIMCIHLPSLRSEREDRIRKAFELDLTEGKIYPKGLLLL